ncbi:MAG: hypothetical protein KTR32_28160 [Granulosicoccus sp.]|nr:hypothetical protein [Granulosicoccus sp.]
MKTLSQLLAIPAAAVVIITLILAQSASLQAQDIFELISAAEAKQAQENPASEVIYEPKAVTGAPVIKVLSPSVESGALTSPVDIEMVFESPDNAAIDMDSLKILYVMLIKKDVTDRILEHATIEDTTLVAKGATLPKGNHQFIVEIQDEKKRKTQETFSVSVSG